MKKNEIFSSENAKMFGNCYGKKRQKIQAQCLLFVNIPDLRNLIFEYIFKTFNQFVAETLTNSFTSTRGLYEIEIHFYSTLLECKLSLKEFNMFEEPEAPLHVSHFVISAIIFDEKVLRVKLNKHMEDGRSLVGDWVEDIYLELDERMQLIDIQR
jgi:hypothetical protein